MNLILLHDSDFITPNRVRLSDRRMAHIRDILKAECTQSLTVGKINGLMGQGKVVSKKTDAIELEVKLDQNPPEALPLTLILALPRPPMLKRILFSGAQLGVKKIIILNFNRVEKSLWNSSSLKPQAITEQLVLGLEQAKDTVMPEVILKKGFKPFVEDELPALIKGKLALVAHPDKTSFSLVSSGGRGRENEGFLIFCPSERRLWRARWGNPRTGPDDLHGDQSDKSMILVVGPEGGIIDYEIELLKAAGCQPIDLGPRILRTESVLPYVVGKLF
jgi:RsmE family RNA methyltransferase